MKNDNRFLILIAVLGGMILFKFDLLGINAYKSEIITTLLVYLVVDYIIRTSLKFKKYVFLKTKYDNLFRLTNLLIGIIATSTLFWNKSQFFEFGWLFFILSFLGIFNGIVYQYSIQLSKNSSGLIVVYKNRNKKVVENPNSIVFNHGQLIISDNNSYVEVNDLKNSLWNRRKLRRFFKNNYPYSKLDI